MESMSWKCRRIQNAGCNVWNWYYHFWGGNMPFQESRNHFEFGKVWSIRRWKKRVEGYWCSRGEETMKNPSWKLVTINHSGLFSDSEFLSSIRTRNQKQDIIEESESFYVNLTHHLPHRWKAEQTTKWSEWWPVQYFLKTRCLAQNTYQPVSGAMLRRPKKKAKIAVS